MRNFFTLKGKQGKRGFTLTELIIVIAILAILAAILVPLMVGYIDDAKEAVADANARSLYSAAAAAATMCIAKGQTVADTSDTGTGDFNAKIKDLLGDNFTGTWTVDAEADGTINGTTWKETATSVVGNYPPTAVSTPV